MRRKAIVTSVAILASVMAFAAPALGAEDTETAVEARSTASQNLTVEVVDDTEVVGTGYAWVDITSHNW